MSELEWCRVGPQGRLANWIYPIVRDLPWFPAVMDRIDHNHVPWTIRLFAFDLGYAVDNWQKLSSMTPEERVLWFERRQEDIGVIDAEYVDLYELDKRVPARPPEPPALQQQLTNGNGRSL